MNKLKIAFCDDDDVAVGLIKSSVISVLNSHGIEAETDTFSSMEQLEKRTLEYHYDLLFLDIDMPRMDGIEFGSRLRKRNDMTELIYVSGREDRVFESFIAKPLGFVRKDCFLKDIAAVMAQYLSPDRFRGTEETIVVKTLGGLQNVPVKDIIYIEGASNCQYIYIENRKDPLKARSILEDFEAELSPKGFLRIHKGFIVNSNFISRIESGNVVLLNGEKLPVSRRKISELKEKFLRIAEKKGGRKF